MLFNSFAFLGFFAVVAVLYYFAPPRWRWVLLLIASAYFYSTYEPRYLILLAYATLVAYGGAQLAAGRAGTTAGKTILTITVLAELSVLVIFKYFNFLAGSLESTLSVVGAFGETIALPRLDVILPAGLSFYTFSAVSYIVDVYRGKIPPERHLGKLALYIAFFPKLLAGPIERAGPFLDQISQRIAFDPARVAFGLQLIVWGLFKKVVIADRLAEYVNAGFNSPDFASPVNLVIAVYFYAFQIYCDFSGYSDIAIGCAAVLGIMLMENFKRPYFARSVPTFWSGRWHISLMQWFRDYLYIPLGGNRVSRLRWYFNQMLIFLVSGLWHGANWTFVIWGALNGAYQVVYFAIIGEKKTEPARQRRNVWMAAAVLAIVAVVLAAGNAIFPGGIAGAAAGGTTVELLAAALAFAAAIALVERPLVGAILLAVGVAMAAAFGFHIFFGAAIAFTVAAAVFAIAPLRPSRFFPGWLWALLSILLTFHVVLFSWIFFRAATVADAFTVIRRIFGALPDLPSLLVAYNWTSGLLLSLALIVVLLLIEALDEFRGLWAWLQRRPTAVRWGFYYGLIACLLVIGNWGVSEFVYMQF